MQFTNTNYNLKILLCKGFVLIQSSKVTNVARTRKKFVKSPKSIYQEADLIKKIR